MRIINQPSRHVHPRRAHQIHDVFQPFILHVTGHFEPGYFGKERIAFSIEKDPSKLLFLIATDSAEGPIAADGFVMCSGCWTVLSGDKRIHNTPKSLEQRA